MTETIGLSSCNKKVKNIKSRFVPGVTHGGGVGEIAKKETTMDGRKVEAASRKAITGKCAVAFCGKERSGRAVLGLTVM